MDQETREWMQSTLTQLTNSKRVINAQQRLEIDQLNAYITQEMIRLSTVSDLKTYNDGIKSLRKYASDRFNEIIKGQIDAIAEMLGNAFALVFLGHLQLLASMRNMTVTLPPNFNIMKGYQGYILGRYYVPALSHAKRGFMKRFTRDADGLRRAWLGGNVDIDTIYKWRDKAAGDTSRHFLFIDDQELHRVFEAAKYESAVYMYEVEGIESYKYWQTKEDDRVRDTMKANHVDMQGKTVRGHELFNLIPDGKAYAPANSGIAAQDINCRCHAIYFMKN